jgi:hypothetical protein
MARYFYSWTPVVIVFAALLVLSIPWLAPIALTIVLLAALAALAYGVETTAHILSHAISRRWQGRSSASPETAPALAPVRHHNA